MKLNDGILSEIRHKTKHCSRCNSFRERIKAYDQVNKEIKNIFTGGTRKQGRRIPAGSVNQIVNSYQDHLKKSHNLILERS